MLIKKIRLSALAVVGMVVIGLLADMVAPQPAQMPYTDAEREVQSIAG